MRHRPAFVLVVVLVVIAMLSLSGYTFSELMLTEYRATRLQGRSVEARLLAESGIEHTRAFLALSEEQHKELGGHFHNPERFQGVVVSGQQPGEIPGRFSIVARPLAGEEPPKLRFGLGQSESAKLNLHTLLEWEQQQPGAGRNALMNLPAMTEDVADAILDWIDADDVPRELGAEHEYYGELEPPYAPANQVPQTLEELLWVRGVTRAMLFGDDQNQNGYIEPTETSLGEDARQSPDQNAGSFGWSAYLTLHSAEADRRPDGLPKINLNDDNLPKLYEQLVEAFDQEWATFIIAYRQFGPYVGSAASAAGEPLPPDLELPGKFRLGSVLDLVAVRVQVTHPNIPAFVLPCPFENNRALLRDCLPQLMDQATVEPAPVRGRINVNEAPREVLMGVPTLSAGQVEDILSKRGREPGAEEETRRHVTWLLVEGVVELDVMKQLTKYLTAGGNVFCAQTVGYLENGPIFRAEFVIDATVAPARLIFWRDLQRLGRGYDLALLGLTPADNLPTTTPP